jgi:hypothetical protein
MLTAGGIVVQNVAGRMPLMGVERRDCGGRLAF